MLSHFRILPFTLLYIIFTIGRNMTFNNTLATAIQNLPVSKNADATAIFQMMQQFAGALGTALAAIMANNSSSLTNGVTNVYLLFTFLAILNYLLYIGMFTFLNKGK